MEIERAEITPNGISIKRKVVKVLVDPDTGENVEVPQPGHREAVGLNDFEGDPVAFKSACEAALAPYGAEVIARAAAAEAERDAERAAKEAAESAKVAAEAERDTLAADKAQLETDKAQLQQQLADETAKRQASDAALSAARAGGGQP